MTYITFEGIDGSGKSTQFKKQIDRLRLDRKVEEYQYSSKDNSYGRLIKEIYSQETTSPLSFLARFRSLQELLYGLSARRNIQGIDVSQPGFVLSWGPGWAKTEKQQKRYEQFQGDEMHFFTGIVVSSRLVTDAEDAWHGDIFMNIQEVIDIIEKSRPFDESVEEYREMQLRFLKKIKESIVSSIDKI